MIRLFVTIIMILLLSGCCAHTHTQRPLTEVNRTLRQVESITYTIERLEERY